MPSLRVSIPEKRLSSGQANEHEFPMQCFWKTITATTTTKQKNKQPNNKFSHWLYVVMNINKNFVHFFCSSLALLFYFILFILTYFSTGIERMQERKKMKKF